jgi:cytochrome c biogenesis protein
MKAFLGLLRSMRFAIAILAVVAVAATTGSVLEQSQPAVTYVSHYGEFWASFFALCGLTDVYHAPWFFILLAFMATSTALCLWQNTPSMLRDMRSFREHKSLASLRNLEHSCELPLPADSASTLQARLAAYLTAQGYRYKQAESKHGVVLAARSGSARRLGYLLVHGAMVLICIGGLVDGNVGLRLKLWTGAKLLETRDLPAGQVPRASRLAADDGSFRATMNIPEGGTASTAQLQLGEGYLQQQLPFAVRLKRFRIEHYPNGQPKDFTSDIEIIDAGKKLPVRLQVNHPYTYRGVTLFQSGFADGGSKVRLNLHAAAGGAAPMQALDGAVGSGSALLLNGEPYALEFTELRAINVFNNDDAGNAPSWSSRGKPGERVRDAGPSLTFRLRDKQGQADEWNVYQRPAAIDGASYFLIGHRRPQDEALHYVRVPADAGGSMDTYLRLTQAMTRPELRAKAARAVAANVEDTRLASTLESTCTRLLAAFSAQGYRALAGLVPANASKEEQMKIGRLYLQLLERAAAQLPAAGAPPRLVHDILAAYNDTLELELPALFQFDSYQQVNATGLQVTHAPGATLVYLGCALLALGVIAMYFVRERRIWLHTSGGAVLLALSANRNSPALRDEFEAHRTAVQSLIATSR